MADSDKGQLGGVNFQGFSDSTSTTLISHGKREREDGANLETRRSKRRNKSKKPKDVEDEALDSELGVNHAVAHMDNQLLADHIAQRTKRFKPELSVVEMDDSYIPGR